MLKNSEIRYCTEVEICVLELHWHAQNANSVTTILPRIRRFILIVWRPRSIVSSVRDILHTRKPNNPSF